MTSESLTKCKNCGFGHVCYANHQSQASLTEQLEKLVLVANIHGLYDAADWLREIMSKVKRVES